MAQPLQLLPTTADRIDIFCEMFSKYRIKFLSGTMTEEEFNHVSEAIKAVTLLKKDIDQVMQDFQGLPQDGNQVNSTLEALYRKNLKITATIECGFIEMKTFDTTSKLIKGRYKQRVKGLRSGKNAVVQVVDEILVDLLVERGQLREKLERITPAVQLEIEPNVL